MSRVSPVRAPSEDGAIVAEPPLEEVASLLKENRRRLQRAGVSFLGRPWTQLQQQARSEVLAAAQRYLTQFGEPLPAVPATGILMAGHQPELFHPGVWVKNFALFSLARKHGLASINLIVDNDTLKSTSLRVPAPGDSASGKAHLVSVPFDHWTGETPWERRFCADPKLFASFPDRVAEVLRPWNYEPLLPAFWAEAARFVRQQATLGDSFAAARRSLERQWGCHNLEVPVSAVCRTEAFATFACHLVGDLPRFHALYNEVVATYRRAHGLRSRSHPVPDLGVEGDWLETPFWGSPSDQTQRGRLYARRTADRVDLRVGAQTWPSLPFVEGAPAEAVRAWQRLEGNGFAVRSRALTNTLFARLFLTDLFIHGIGGGKYDELTDAILRRFYDCEPPRYLVLSATRLLPLPAAPVSVEDCRRLARAVRDVHYNPQRHLRDHEALSAEKQVWIERTPKDKQQRHERFEKLRAITAQLREPLLRHESKLREELKQCERQLETNAVLQRRDYAFVLYPEAMLREFCTRFL